MVFFLLFKILKFLLFIQISKAKIPVKITLISLIFTLNGTNICLYAHSGATAWLEAHHSPCVAGFGEILYRSSKRPCFWKLGSSQFSLQCRQIFSCMYRQKKSKSMIVSSVNLSKGSAASKRSRMSCTTLGLQQ